MFKPLILIPVYNHPHCLEGIVAYCREHDWPVLMVDDGSNAETKAAIAKVASRFDRVFVETLAQNGGKGAAVMAGIQWAQKEDYSHTMQLDADGQQNIDRTAEFLDLAQKQPNALINGYPVYDETVPASRKWGRKLTNFWVAINTLSLAFKDTMCGFRVYPVDATLDAVGNIDTLGKRMQFDPEIAVRLHWGGIRTVNAPVEVTYPIDGISHFRAIENWNLSKMHCRCFFGMLWRLPKLIAFHFR